MSASLIYVVLLGHTVGLIAIGNQQVEQGLLADACEAFEAPGRAARHNRNRTQAP